MTEILSPNMYKGRIKKIRLNIIHTMEVNENDTNVAESVARQFQNPVRRASAHVCIDTDSEVTGVHDEDTAWASPGANADGLQQELAGRAGQSMSEWSDAASQAILERSAQRSAKWARKWGLPVRHLSVAEVRDGVTMGICGHIDVTNAFHGSTHWDPGPNFPWESYLNRVNAILNGTPTPAPVVVVVVRAEEDDEMGRSIEALYRKILGRGAGQDEIDTRLLDTAANGTTLHQHYLSILMSDEAEAYAAKITYATGLGRKAGPAEIKAWVDSANGPDAVRAGILASNEAKAFAAIDPTLRAAAIAEALK
jgi:N-acetyl-anhydromuramyl-L-alanine amidase AmpD